MGWGKKENINICIIEGDRRFDGIILSLCHHSGSCPDITVNYCDI